MITASPSTEFSSRKLLGILLILILVEINSAFEVGMMYGILATLVREFGDPVGVGWLLTGFLLVGAASSALCSRLGDIYGRRRVVMVMLVCAMAGSLISALASNLFWLVVGRSVQGVAAALLPLCIGLVREYFPAGRVPLTVGWLAAIASFSAMAGIVLGGWLADTAGWRFTFWLGAGHALLSLLVTWLLLPPSVAAGLKGRLDVLGGVLFAPAIGAFLLGVSRIQAQGWSNALTLCLLAGGLVLFALWYRYEARHPNPMLDVKQFNNRQIALGMGVMLLYGLGTSQLMMMVLLIAQQPVWTGIGLGLSATFAAWIKMPAGISGLLAAPWSGRLAARHGAKRAMVVGTVGISLSWVALALWHDAVWQLVLLSFFATAAGAVIYAAVPNLLLEVTPADRTSEITGMSMVLMRVGTAVGTLVVTMLLASASVSGTGAGTGHFPAPSAYGWAFLAINSFAAVSVVLALLLPNRPSRVTAQAAAA